MERLQRADTGNEFRYLNISDMNTCYQYYERYATNLVNRINDPIKNPYNRKGIKTFVFDYLWKSSLNAGGAEFEAKDGLVINEGTLLNIYGLFYKLNTKINTTIELSHVVENITQLNSTIIYHNECKPEEPIISQIIFSDNVILNNISEYMAMCAIKFLIAHEIGHIFNGHTKYYKDVRNQIKRIEENGGKDLTKLNQLYLDLQTMEMDADAFAICRLIDEVIDLFITKDKILELLKTPSDVIKLLIYAIHGIFYLCKDTDQVNYMKKEHPPSLIRESLIYEAMIGYFSKKYNLDVSAVLANNLGTIDRHFYYVDNASNSQFMKYLDEFAEEADTYAEKIMNNYWEKVSLILEADARLPIEKKDLKDY